LPNRLELDWDRLSDDATLNTFLDGVTVSMQQLPYLERDFELISEQLQKPTDRLPFTRQQLLDELWLTSMELIESYELRDAWERFYTIEQLTGSVKGTSPIDPPPA
jgi:hypothetical protein